MRFLFLLTLLAVFGFPALAGAAIVFDDGQVHDFSGTDSTGAFIRDSAEGSPTTVNLLSGADLGPTDVEDASLLRVYAGATLSDVDAFGTSRVVILGGDHGTVDLNNDSQGSVSGGSFLGCLPCLRLFAQATATVMGGTFSSPSQIVVVTNGFAALELRAGSFDGIVRANDDSSLEIFGGDFVRIISVDQAVLTVYGEGFSALEGSTTVLSGFGEIPEGFNGTISGTLADGSPFSVTALNGVSGSRIVLAAAPPVAVPGLASPIARSLLLLVCVAAGVATVQLRGARRPG
jgi:hypothetical protein